jgi:hypothetical protein
MRMGFTNLWFAGQKQKWPLAFQKSQDIRRSGKTFAKDMATESVWTCELTDVALKPCGG